ncbi:MAG TPA: L,D-transpeptidase [Vicinamibacteria bacterium]|jgi:lipoprotein-anchoring transpeptidase ErfK/SrfK
MRMDTPPLLSLIAVIACTSQAPNPTPPPIAFATATATVPPTGTPPPAAAAPSATTSALVTPDPLGTPVASPSSASPAAEPQAPPSPEPPQPSPSAGASPAGKAAGETLRLQVLLDRAHFSPGEIDGQGGANTRRAQAAYEKSSGRTAGLIQDAAPTLVAYTIAADEVAGPFVKVPEDMLEKAKLKTLGYSSPLEALGEKFHASPKLLRRLNPNARFAAGEEIQVPNVSRGEAPGKAATVVVDQSDSSVTALDAAGKVLARYPATMGSEHDPLPLGKWKITGVQRNPTFFYNADLFWDADEKHAKAKIAPGPNNPVGVVWIDLSKEHYGIHGTPEPSTIGKTESHGCIRLTNWDVLQLADIVKAGIPAILQQ